MPPGGQRLAGQPTEGCELARGGWGAGGGRRGSSASRKAIRAMCGVRSLGALHGRCVSFSGASFVLSVFQCCLGSLGSVGDQLGVDWSAVHIFPSNVHIRTKMGSKTQCDDSESDSRGLVEVARPSEVYRDEPQASLDYTEGRGRPCVDVHLFGQVPRTAVECAKMGATQCLCR